MKKVKWPGHGYKVSCHRCGFWYISTEIRKEWTGILACPKCWEPRHPQTLIKVHGEKAVPSFVSKDGEPVFGDICNVATKSAYADMGTANCMQADNTSIPYDTLLGLFGNGHGTP